MKIIPIFPVWTKKVFAARRKVFAAGGGKLFVRGKTVDRGGGLAGLERKTFPVHTSLKSGVKKKLAFCDLQRKRAF